MKLTLIQYDLRLVVAKLAPPCHLETPREGFWCVLQTPGEITLVCEERLLPDAALKAESEWMGFKLRGPLDFSLTGIIAGLSDALAKAQISLFVLSTFDTDWILVKRNNAEAAINAWRTAGYEVVAQ